MEQLRIKAPDASKSSQWKIDLYQSNFGRRSHCHVPGKAPAGVVPSITRIAHGLPVGDDLEYVDEMTLTKALEGRHQI